MRLVELQTFLLAHASKLATQMIYTRNEIGLYVYEYGPARLTLLRDRRKGIDVSNLERLAARGLFRQTGSYGCFFQLTPAGLDALETPIAKRHVAALAERYRLDQEESEKRLEKERAEMGDFWAQYPNLGDRNK